MGISSCFFQYSLCTCRFSYWYVRRRFFALVGSERSLCFIPLLFNHSLSEPTLLRSVGKCDCFSGDCGDRGDSGDSGKSGESGESGDRGDRGDSGDSGDGGDFGNSC